ncbi:hypothetical protein E2C01_067404 [Portunus trituberculatus]|uniref:Uncharacterized protein n=1 Tax=Portunus trituberculatus TaxID=210409 RepID=A0A5B7HTN4_PORTR|nr:hypothetical protein [Portunus trituberculatus]
MRQIGKGERWGGREQGKEGGRKLIAVCCIKSSQFVILNGIIPEFNCFPLGTNAVDRTPSCSRGEWERNGRGRRVVGRMLGLAGERRSVECKVESGMKWNASEEKVRKIGQDFGCTVWVSR